MVITAARDIGITLTGKALARLRAAREKLRTPEAVVRVRLLGGGCAGFTFDLSFDRARRDDRVSEVEGLTVVMDPKSAVLLEGAVIDFQEGLAWTGFTLKHPKAQSTCGCGKSFTLS